MSGERKLMSGHRYVLVVDDEPTHRILTRECLEEIGLEVREASNGDEALAMVREQAPSLILLDLNMPGRSGISVLKELRADEHISRIPVVIVTGADEASAVERAFNEKANDFVTKPVFWPLLPHRLRFVLRNEEQEERLRKGLFEAKKADAAKSEFLSAVSHELRTPLNAIIGFSDILMRDQNNEIDRQGCSEYAGYIYSSGQHLLNIVTDILDIAKIEEGKFNLQLEDVNFSNLLDDCLPSIRQICERPCHELVMNVDECLPLISADPKRLRQIILNLVSNAAKFTNAGGRIEIAARGLGDGGIVLSVSDNGIGMSPEEIETAIRPFEQVDSKLSRKYEGTGLGLPLTVALVELHQGGFEIESAPGQGTTVSVYFPKSFNADTQVRLSSKAVA